jgi:exopolysaccharide biosynthesis polyprenyl glycosylphosphotransferase
VLKQNARVRSLGLRVLDVAALSAAFPLAYLVRDRLLAKGPTELYPIVEYWPVLALTLLLWIGFSWVSRVYAPYRKHPVATEFLRLAQALGLVALAISALAYLLRREDVSRLFVAGYFALGLLLLFASRAAVRMFARSAGRGGLGARRFAVAGCGSFAREVVRTIAANPEWGLAFAGYVVDGPPPEPLAGEKILGTMEDLPRLLQSHVLDEVIFALPRQRLDEIEGSVLLCEEQGVAARVCVELFTPRIAKVEVDDLDGIPALSFSTTPSDALALVGKRAFDVCVSLAALVALAPLLTLVAIAIRLDSPGPVFFRQRRVGVNGREFALYKFRSMYADAEARLAALRDRNEVTGPVFKMRDDPRVTRVGRFIRRASIDELPQFWNVLRGEMSVVGPRPPLPSEVREYARWQRRRLSVKPGITCTWQVSGRNEIEFERWMRLDLHYIDNWSLWHDLKLVVKTIPAVLSGRGAR